jgi:3-methyl-2-oxobutanoate hydroxymethyltransferase
MAKNKKISVLTCYDYSFAKAVDGLLDYVLVGDSVDMVVYGEKSTQDTSLQKMQNHTKAVSKGLKKTKLIADIPKESLISLKVLLNSAKKLTEAGAEFLKIENNPEFIHKLSTCGYKVFGHIGYTPQTNLKPKKTGVNNLEKLRLVKQSLEIQEAGAVGIILELVEDKTAQIITEKLKIPTIGIGSGKNTTGQVLVLYDLIGLYPDFTPPFVKKQLHMQGIVKEAVRGYLEDINSI